MLARWVLSGHIDRYPIAYLTGDPRQQVRFKAQQLAAVGHGISKRLESSQERKRLSPLSESGSKWLPVLLGDSQEVVELSVCQLMTLGNLERALPGTSTELFLAPFAPRNDPIRLCDSPQPVGTVLFCECVSEQLPEGTFAHDQGFGRFKPRHGSAASSRTRRAAG